MEISDWEFKILCKDLMYSRSRIGREFGNWLAQYCGEKVKLENLYDREIFKYNFITKEDVRYCLSTCFPDLDDETCAKLMGRLRDKLKNYDNLNFLILRILCESLLPDLNEFNNNSKLLLKPIDLTLDELKELRSNNSLNVTLKIKFNRMYLALKHSMYQQELQEKLHNELNGIENSYDKISISDLELSEDETFSLDEDLDDDDF